MSDCRFVGCAVGGKRLDHLGSCSTRTALEVLHGAEGRLVPGLGRTDDTVGDHAHAVVVLVCVSERVVDAHVRQPPDQHERRRPEPFEEYLEVGAEEAGVAPLRDAVLARPGNQRRPQLRPIVAFEAVNPFDSVEFATEVDGVGPVCLLEEDDGEYDEGEGISDFEAPLPRSRSGSGRLLFGRRDDGSDLEGRKW